MGAALSLINHSGTARGAGRIRSTIVLASGGNVVIARQTLYRESEKRPVRLSALLQPDSHARPDTVEVLACGERDFSISDRQGKP